MEMHSIPRIQILEKGYQEPGSARQSPMHDVRIVCAAKLYMAAILPNPLTLDSLLIDEPFLNEIILSHAV